METTSANSNPKKALFERLKDSPLLAEFHRAFRLSTGLPLRLVGPDSSEWCLQGSDDNRSPFCVKLNTCRAACDACQQVNTQLLQTAEVHGATSCRCFTGMTATAVPIRLGPQVIAYLKTGQVFTKVPSEAEFEEVMSSLNLVQLLPDEREQFKSAYFNTRVLNPDRFQSMVDLLIIFARQLCALAEELAVASSNRESENIKRARHFIHQQLDQKLILSEIARHAGMSPSHLSRTFKDEVGLTVTDYITRSRIKWACRELGRPNARISDVAYLVGFQSLSQFNRAFLKVIGKNPSDYRHDRFDGLVA